MNKTPNNIMIFYWSIAGLLRGDVKQACIIQPFALRQVFNISTQGAINGG